MDHNGEYSRNGTLGHTTRVVFQAPLFLKICGFSSLNDLGHIKLSQHVVAVLQCVTTFLTDWN